MKTLESMEIIPLSDTECLKIDGGLTWWELEMYATSAWNDAKTAFNEGINDGYDTFKLK